MENCIFIDVFTTQNEIYGKNNCPIQFSCELFALNDITDAERFISKVERRKVFNLIPDEEISMAGFYNSGVNSSMVNTSDYNGVKLEEGLKSIYDILLKTSKGGFYFIGFNHINYDLKILNETFKRVLNLEPIEIEADKVIDIMKWFESEVSITEIGNYTMESCWAYMFNEITKLSNLKLNKSTTTDIKITKLLFRALLKKYMSENITSFSDIVKRIDDNAKNIKVFNFGKYKGLEITKVFELDKQYLNWVINNKDMKKNHQYVVETIKSLYNSDNT